jgi:RNA-dependent RNA polymerase
VSARKALSCVNLKHSFFIRGRFCKVLDGAKLGLTVIPEVFKKHCVEFNRSGPVWKDTLKKNQKKAGSRSFNTTYLDRGRGLPVFVMDTLRECARQEKHKVWILVHERFQPGAGIRDTDLIAPWLEAQELAQRESKEEKSTRRSTDLDKIAAHVAEVYESWKDRAKKAGSFTDLRINTRQDVLRRLSKKFASISTSQELLYSSTEIARLAASYAYLFDSQRAKSGWSRFPWDVALRELCHIKAQALGPWKTVNGGFYDRFQIKPTFFNH